MLQSVQLHFKSRGMLHLSSRDRDLLRLLDRTPATVELLLRASSTFAGQPFRDERRVRERLQQLASSGLVRRFGLAQAGGGVMNYYKLTPQGFAALGDQDAPQPPRAYFAEIPLSRLQHTLELAEVIVHTVTAAVKRRIEVAKFHRENELTLAVGDLRQQPDFHAQFSQAGRVFNVLFELDRGNESVDSLAESSIRQKILGYEAYQDMVWQAWRQAGGRGVRPYFKVAFLTSSTSRAYHILALARTLARNRDRRLCYAAALAEYLACPDALREALFVDHHGGWQALVNGHPAARLLRAPVRLPDVNDQAPPVWYA